MNISFSATLPGTSSSFEVTPSNASQENHQASGETVASPSIIAGNADSQAEQQSDNRDEGQERRTNENSQQARQAALADPNSALSKQLDELQNRDREVRAHEQAHLVAAGGFATGGPSFTFQQGPDGQRYAVGGSVNIDTSAIAGDPEATLRKAQTIRRAALAPGEPSSQDRRVAAQASNLANQAQQEISQLSRQETEQAHAKTQNDSSESPEPRSRSAEDVRNSLEKEIQNTGALGEAKPSLDFIA